MDDSLPCSGGMLGVGWRDGSLECTVIRGLQGRVGYTCTCAVGGEVYERTAPHSGSSAPGARFALECGGATVLSCPDVRRELCRVVIFRLNQSLELTAMPPTPVCIQSDSSRRKELTITLAVHGTHTSSKPSAFTLQGGIELSQTLFTDLVIDKKIRPMVLSLRGGGTF